MQHPENLYSLDTSSETSSKDPAPSQPAIHRDKPEGEAYRKDMKGANLMGADFSGQDLHEVNLEGAILFNANLRGANLSRANLKNAELTGADLSGANLEWADLSKAGLGKAVLIETRLFNANLNYTTLTGANLQNCDLKSASIQQARFHEADLQGADFTSADLSDTDLSKARVENASFLKANLKRANLYRVTGFEKASWIGTDMREINFSGAYLLQRFARDQNYIKEFRERSTYTRLLYHLWWITSDCGRSITRWLTLICVVGLIYAGLYTQVNINYGSHDVIWFTPIYYSFVTMTSLGYGDIAPVDLVGKMLAVSEVLIGYIMLGGLLSIFANKLARRAD